MENINIIFCNFYHIGDTHFAQPFVKNIIKNNPNNEYYIFHNYNTYSFLNEINELKDINSNLNLKDSILNNIFNTNYISDNEYNFSEKENIHEVPKFSPDFLTIYNSELKILLINTWIGPLFHQYPIIECNLISYSKSYDILINNINNMYNLNIIYDNSINLDILPNINKIYIETFLNIKNTINKKIIFYYNYLGKSGQTFIINNEYEHNLVIKYLSLKYMVIIPYKNKELENYIIENNVISIIFAEDLFDKFEDYSCKNLYYYAQMAYDSDISVYFDTGRNFLYINKNFISDNNNNLRLHFSHDTKYYNAINDENIIKKNYVRYINAYNYNDIINYFEKII